MKFIQAFNLIFGKLFNRVGAYISLSLLYTERKRELDRNYMDYIRLGALELVANEIATNRVEGAVAELGVYKGKFARYINQYFPDRSFYLFDTFEGFDQADVKVELQQSFSGGNQDFSNTSVEEVLKRMPHPANCIVKQGFFPATAQGLEAEFAFVSIDTDLYEPIYNGLVYFYPRLKKGGYLFVHDYNNDEYKGAREAVDRFCKEQGVPRFPLPDSAGSAVLMK